MGVVDRGEHVEEQQQPRLRIKCAIAAPAIADRLAGQRRIERAQRGAFEKALVRDPALLREQCYQAVGELFVIRRQLRQQSVAGAVVEIKQLVE